MAIIDPDQLLPLLTSEEKIKLLSGDDMWHTVAVPRLGIPRVRVSDPSESRNGAESRDRCQTDPTV